MISAQMFAALGRSRWGALCCACDALLLVVVVAHVINAPFTKVEESFNVQAVHDVLFHGPDLQQYDHQDFPGVVPRTFLGAAVLAALSSSLVYPLHYILGFNKLVGLYVMRFTLGFVAWLCMVRLRVGIQRALGAPTAAAFMLLTSCQFHMPFYMSRPLPNTFALCIVSVANAHWLDGSQPWLVPALLTFASVVFRCDMVLLTATVSLHLLLSRRVSFWGLVGVGAAAGALSVAATVAFDSLFWGRLLWPEGEVLWFNTVLNKSKEWGVMPFHWYFSSALPRALLVALPLAPWGVYSERRLRGHVAAFAAFIFLYSFLGHKELRFLLPALPIANVAAAACLVRLLANARKSPWRALLAAAAVAGVVLSALAAAFFATASHYNYPGGHAFVEAHARQSLSGREGGWLTQRAAPRGEARLHICTLPAMTGVSRFGQVASAWKYNKKQEVAGKEVPLHVFLKGNEFDLVLAGEEDLQEVPEGYSLASITQGFSHFKLHKSPQAVWERLRQLRMPLEVVLVPKVLLLTRSSDSSEQNSSLS